MKYRFWANLKIIFQLDDPAFTQLEDCMKIHYDHTIKAATQLGGFMYSLRRRRDFKADMPDDEYRNTVELDVRQLQLCMKALEMRQYRFGDRLDELNTQLWKISLLYNEQMRLLNEEVLAPGGEV